MDGTELAISESQERMAVVVAETNAPAFMAAAERENLEAAVVARVEEDGYLTMVWRGETIVRLSRAFLDTNGVTQSAKATITAPRPSRRLPEGHSRRPSWAVPSGGLPAKHGPTGGLRPTRPGGAV